VIARTRGLEMAADVIEQAFLSDQDVDAGGTPQGSPTSEERKALLLR
jgi:hypothetical protein